ncbi:MAG: hypothetical protein ED557_10335 [Balneola sp.]|nr:MAG: hypothetical protein ED557_10335 [Balneola sp.]
MILTSKLNFSITKKRLLMMSRSSPFIQRFGKVLPLVPLLLFIGLMFCEKRNVEDELYTDVKVTVDLASEDIENSIPSSPIHKDKNGRPFTGTSSMYYKKNDQLYSTATYVNGIQTGWITFDENGNERYRVKKEYDEAKWLSTKHFSRGKLKAEWLYRSVTDSEYDIHREYYPDGILKFEMSFTSGSENKPPLIYQGLMTLYDEQGNVLEQELYKDGELVEKIK